MATPRPLTKAVMKRMFLKTLHEHAKSGGKYVHDGGSVTGVIKGTMLRMFGLEPLSNKEYAEAQGGIRVGAG